jgi:hypothetical protein
MNALELSSVRDWEQLPDELKVERINHTPAENWVETITFIAGALKGYEVEAYEDAVFEIADGLVPVYTAEKWQEMNDLSLWAVSDIEFSAYELLGDTEDDGDPLFKVINAYLYAYYLKVAEIVVQYLNETGEDSE